MKTQVFFSKDVSIDYAKGNVSVRMQFPESMAKEDIQTFLDKYAGKKVDITINEYAEDRTTDANAMLWACLKDISMARAKEGDHITTWDLYLEALENYGQFQHLAIMAQYVPELKRMYRDIKVIREYTTYDDEEEIEMAEVLAFIGSSNYNKKEFSKLLSGVVEDMRTWGLVPPSSEDMERTLRELERRK